MLSIHLFNIPKVTLDGNPVAFPFKRADALLYYMTVEKSATRREIVALLWEECDESTGLKNLRNTLYTIRKVLGGDFILSEQNSVLTLNPSFPYESDYDRFITGKDLQAYTGEFLKGFAIKHSFAFEEWSAEKAGKLREFFTERLESEAKETLSAGNTEMGVSLLRELLRMDPCNEAAAVLLMTEYGRREAYQKAADLYARLREALKEELGTEPLEKTRDCYYRLMNLWNRNAPGTPSEKETPAALPDPGKITGAAREAAKLLSAMPEGMPFDVYTALLEQVPQAGGGLGPLFGGGFLSESGTGGSRLLTFSSSDAGNTFYDMIPVRERKKLHGEITKILLSRPDRDSEEILRATGLQYELAGDRLSALECKVRALYYESERAFVPFSGRYPRKTTCISPKEAMEKASRYQSELGALRIPSVTKGRLTSRLLFVEGASQLFSGEIEEGIRTLGEISGIDGVRDDSILLSVCYVLSQNAIYRQEPDFAERYILTALHTMERNPQERTMRAQFCRLLGCVLCCKKSYDKANYYLREAINLIKKLPEGPEKQIWLSAAESDMGRVRRYQQGYGDATASFRKAIEMLPEGAWPGITWVYVHYGRTIFALDDHMRAEELFRKARELAEITGETAGRAAAAAYCAFYYARQKDSIKAAEALSEAFRYAEKCGSPLEQGILSFVCMRLRRELVLTRQTENPLCGLLTDSAESYARGGIRILAGIPDVYEEELMKKALRDGIMTRESYKVSELYSKNKRFMTE